MPNQLNPQTDPNQSTSYQIRIKGHLGHEWEDWFGDATITPEANGNTLLVCSGIDQSALHGLLRKVRDLGMPLISVNRIEPDQTDTPDVRSLK